MDANLDFDRIGKMGLCGEASGTPANCGGIALRMDGEEILAPGGIVGCPEEALAPAARAQPFTAH